MDDPISKLAATMRAGLRGEEWQDSNSFVYSDPRYDGKILHEERTAAYYYQTLFY